MKSKAKVNKTPLKEAAKQPPGKKTMIDGKNRNQKGKKRMSDDTPV